ncbi:MAG: SDR family oxidoreductase [Nocardioidaceae bacterium]|nr:SDR family oxidoreductase [Nocardioidaceae bacterium]
MRAVVTGASSGIGRALALHLARSHGAAVIAVGRRGDLLESLAAEVASVVPVVGDVADLATARAVSAVLGDVEGDTLCLVNAAGVTGPIGPVGRVDLLQWREALMTNLLGPVQMTEVLTRQLESAAAGWIINVSSAQAVLPPAGVVAAYATQKAALVHYTRCVAEQFAGSAVAAVAIHPGDVLTAMWDDIESASRSLGAGGASLADSVAGVRAGGGDSMDRVIELLDEILGSPPATTNGRFLFARGSGKSHLEPPP